MKTPREILTEKHKSAAPKLDALRQEIVAQLNQRPKAQRKKVILVPWRLGGLKLLWHELFLPSRRIWTGLAAIWIVILAVNFSMRDHAPTDMAKSVSPEMVQTFKQQEQLLTELIGPIDSSAAEPQKSYTPRPSSQRYPEILTA
jgi:hypothetical protein